MANIIPELHVEMAVEVTKDGKKKTFHSDEIQLRKPGFKSRSFEVRIMGMKGKCKTVIRLKDIKQVEVESGKVEMTILNNRSTKEQRIEINFRLGLFKENESEKIDEMKKFFKGIDSARDPSLLVFILPDIPIKASGKRKDRDDEEDLEYQPPNKKQKKKKKNQIQSKIVLSFQQVSAESYSNRDKSIASGYLGYTTKFPRRSNRLAGKNPTHYDNSYFENIGYRLSDNEFWSGITNLGNTCYMSSILNTLRHLKESFIKDIRELTIFLDKEFVPMNPIIRKTKTKKKSSSSSINSGNNNNNNNNNKNNNNNNNLNVKAPPPKDQFEIPRFFREFVRCLLQDKDSFSTKKRMKRKKRNQVKNIEKNKKTRPSSIKIKKKNGLNIIPSPQPIPPPSQNIFIQENISPLPPPPLPLQISKKVENNVIVVPPPPVTPPPPKFINHSIINVVVTPEKNKIRDPEELEGEGKGEIVKDTRDFALTPHKKKKRTMRKVKISTPTRSYKMKEEDEDLDDDDDEEEEEQKKKEDEVVIDPTKLKRITGESNSIFAGGLQQDTHEFLLTCFHLFKADVERMKKIIIPLLQSRKSIIFPNIQSRKNLNIESQKLNIERIGRLFHPLEKNFGGVMVRIFTCPNCGGKKNVNNDFELISVPIVQKEENLDTVLQNFFSVYEVERKCGICGVNGISKVITKIQRLPRILIIHLKRFLPKYNRESGTYSQQKLHHVVKLQNSVQANPFVCSNMAEENREVIYDMNSFIIHEGRNTKKGHYLCYTKNVEEGWWFKINDDITEKLINEKKVYCSRNEKRVYIVMMKLR